MQAGAPRPAMIAEHYRVGIRLSAALVNPYAIGSLLRVFLWARFTVDRFPSAPPLTEIATMPYANNPDGIAAWVDAARLRGCAVWLAPIADSLDPIAPGAWPARASSGRRLGNERIESRDGTLAPQPCSNERSVRCCWDPRDCG